MTTTHPVPSALEDLKAAQQQIWSSGDYGRIAWITVPLARELVEAVELRPGARVLDVACGTGHVALEAARTFGDVVGVDYVPELVDVARRRALAEGLDVDFQVGDAEALAVRRRLLRRRALGDRRDVHRRPRPCRRRAGPGLPSRRTPGPGQLDPDRVRRPDAQDRRASTSRPRPRPSRRPGGGSRRSSVSCSVTGSTTSRPTPPR